jgi:ABC-type glycerol-3-phosphate transport system substrate-binding protein
MAIPFGDRGHDKEAFELIRWMCGDPIGTRYIGRTMKLLPAFRKSPFFEKDIKGDRVMEAFYEILQRAKRVRPVSPVAAYYMTELMRALGRIRNGALTPEDALTEARQNVTKEWVKTKSRIPPRHVQAATQPAAAPGG